MRKTRSHFEQVPVETAEKVLEQENLLAKRDGDHEFVAENSAGMLSKPKTLSRESGVQRHED
jgi:hypothetical protein